MKHNFLKVTTSILLTMSPMSLIFSSCGQQSCQHEKGKLLSIITEKQDIDFPGLYECGKCHEQYVDSLSINEIAMPTMNIIGSLEGISKQNPIRVQLSYQDLQQKYDFSSDAEIKLQGDWTLSDPKKNYNITFLESGTEKKRKIQLLDNWEPMSKITLKGNYCDALRCHNSASAKIFGDVVHSRGAGSPTAGHLDPLINGGAVDSFPIALYNDGDFLGLYTINFPKNKTLFNMQQYDDSGKQAIIFSADNVSRSTAFFETMKAEEFNTNFWSVEYCSTGDEQTSDYQWAIDSFNEFINFVLDPENDGNPDTWDAAIFNSNLNQYVEVDRLIDYYIFMDFGALSDGIAKNILWVKYPDSKWFPSAYDMDYSFGYANKYHGGTRVHLCEPDEEIEAERESNLWNKLNRDDTFKNDIKARYKVLRGLSSIDALSPLSLGNIVKKYDDFVSLYGAMFYEADLQRWLGTPLRTTNNLEFLHSFVEGRCDYCDTKYS